MLEPVGDYWDIQLAPDEVVVSGLSAPPAHSVNQVTASTTGTGTCSGGMPIKPNSTTIDVNRMLLDWLCRGRQVCTPTTCSVRWINGLVGISESVQISHSATLCREKCDPGTSIPKRYLETIQPKPGRVVNPCFHCSKWVNRATTQLSFFK